MKTIARETAAKLNGYQDRALVKFIIPVKGFSSLSVEGGALYEPETDKILVEELKKNLHPEISVIEVDSHINTPEFARALVDALRGIL
jgi:uncharacterized protein (UPF0261 family)